MNRRISVVPRALVQRSAACTGRVACRSSSASHCALLLLAVLVWVVRLCECALPSPSKRVDRSKWGRGVAGDIFFFLVE
jgi:hypothetical protein